MSARKICDECAGLPLTRSVHDVVPRREMTAVFGSPAIFESDRIDRPFAA